MRAAATALLAGLALAGCAAVPEAPAPREIRAGEDVCEYCHMSVDLAERAAQWVSPDGRTLAFDEPGCLVAWLDARPAEAGAPFVADAAGSGWVPAEEAWFARDAASTGMGFDVLAYRDSTAAAAAGEVVRWDRLRAEGVEHAHVR